MTAPPTIAGPPGPLGDHEHRATRDRDEAIDIITKVYVPHRLVLPTRTVDLSLDFTELNKLVIGHLSYGAESHLIAPKLETFYHVNLTVRGSTRSTRGGEQVVTDKNRGLVFLPSEAASVHWSKDCLQLAMKIDKRGLEEELEKLLGRTVRNTIRFDLALDVRRAPVGGFLRSLHFLRDEIERGDGLAATPAGLRQLENLVITSLLLGQPSNYWEELHRGPARLRPRTVDTVLQMMEDDPAAPLSLGDYASAVGVSARALQEGFRRHLDSTPMEYLRDIRLRRAREDLTAADPSTSTVGAVMSRWGLVHLGRASVAYRRRYGELPSQTLLRNPITIAAPASQTGASTAPHG